MIKLYWCNDIFSHKKHIRYLMQEEGNSAFVVGTYNDNKKTITLKEDAFDLLKDGVTTYMRKSMRSNEKGE